MKPFSKSSAFVAATVAALALSASALAAPTTTISVDDAVHCAGTNSCKGTSDCKSAENKCKGQNACKGHGFVKAKAGDCLAKGGKIVGLNK